MVLSDMNQGDTDQGFSSPVEKQANQQCMGCGSHLATEWITPDGRAWLCRECATLDGLGCP